MSYELEILEKIKRLERDIERLSTQGGTGKWTDYTPTYGGFSTDPTNVIARYYLVGKLCTAKVFMGTAGTSNANTFTVSAPFTAGAQGVAYVATPFHVDGGTNVFSGGIVMIGSNGTAFQLTTASGSYTGWTTSGAKRAYFTITYEVA